MFKGKENSMRENGNNYESGGLNTIVSGTVISGNVHTSGSIRFDGALKGKLECRGKVVVGTSGVIEGDIICVNADISGKVHGNIKTEELVSLKAGSEVLGDITTTKLSIEPGAVFTGRCTMNQVQQALGQLNEVVEQAG